MIKKCLKPVIFTLIALALWAINAKAHQQPYSTESYYSSSLYRSVADFGGHIFDFFTFSFAEFVLYFLVMYLLFCFVKNIIKIVRKQISIRTVVVQMLAWAVSFVSVVYSVFIIFCGINYARPSFAELAGLQTALASKEELEVVTKWIVEQTNSSRSRLGFDHEPFDLDDLSAAQEQASSLFSSSDNELLNGFTPKPKPVLGSYLMSQLNITGFYFPFTFESNINVHQPDCSIPSTMLHELAHYKGFMREYDANFIAFKLGHESDNAVFQYSSNMMALVYTLNAYRSVASSEEYSKMYSLISPDVRNDLAVEREYWSGFDTPVAVASEKINDTYLRSNRQISGVQSYGEVVDLIISYYSQLR